MLTFAFLFLFAGDDCRYFSLYLYRRARRIAIFYVSRGARRQEIFDVSDTIATASSVSAEVGYGALTVSINGQPHGVRTLQGPLEDCNSDSPQGCYFYVRKRRDATAVGGAFPFSGTIDVLNAVP